MSGSQVTYCIKIVHYAIVRDGREPPSKVTGTQDIEDRGYCFWNGLRGKRVNGRVKEMEGEVFCEKEWKVFKLEREFFFLHDKEKVQR